jgi:hypothetical protein
MAPPGTQGALFALESTVVQVNGHCQIRSSGELRVVVLHGFTFAHFALGRGPAFYGRPTSLVTLVLMALLRIKHPPPRCQAPSGGGP